MIYEVVISRINKNYDEAVLVEADSLIDAQEQIETELYDRGDKYVSSVNYV